MTPFKRSSGLVVPMISTVPRVSVVPLDTSSGFLDPKSGLFVLGEVTDRSGFLYRVGGFCLCGEFTGE